jgi:hypothetical protein
MGVIENEEDVMSEAIEKNYEKQATYAQRMAQLKKAVVNGFYFEAIFLEYAVLEDRTESVLVHEGSVKLTNRRGNPLSLYDKIKLLRDNKAFSDKYVRTRITEELLESIDKWRVRRNDLVNELMKNTIPYEELKEVAMDGMSLIKTFDSKAKSVNLYFDKRK